MPTHPPLSPAAIAAAAIRLADEDGLDAVTMRRVATGLGVSAMALYRHVADRRALLLLMADAATGDYALLPPGEHTWQQMLQHMANAQWEVFTAHPWLLHVVLTPRRLVNTAAPEEIDRLLSRLVAAGLTEEMAFDCLLGISAAVIGAASITVAAHLGPDTDEPDAPGPWSAVSEDLYPLAARFQEQGISHALSRRSLDYVLANFLGGVERTLRN